MAGSQVETSQPQDLNPPIIDFSKDAMKPGTSSWKLACKDVRKALEEFGCFKATFNEISQELDDAFFDALVKMFDLPKETKRRFTSDVPFSGYLADMPKTPLHEAMGVPDPLRFQTIENLANCLWHDGDANFRETLHSYVTKISELEKTVRRMIFESYGVEKHFESLDESMKYSLRLLKYGAPMTNEATVGHITHYDKNFLTILQGSGVGLEVQGKDGQWISLTPSGSSFAVMIGESFHGWSNGRLHCPLHRVRMSGWKPRYSVGFFSTNEDRVEVPGELVDDEHPLLFKPFDQAGIYQILMKQLMEKANDDEFVDDDDNILPIVRTHYAI